MRFSFIRRRRQFDSMEPRQEEKTSYTMALCDDQKVYRQQIIGCLGQLEMEVEITVVEFESGQALIQAYQDGTRFDFLFLDIEMEQISGMDTAKAVRQIDRDAIIIFITNHDSYVFEAFNVQAFQFLLKPVKASRLKTELTRAIAHYQELHVVYSVQNKAGWASERVSNIQYLEVQGHNLLIHTCDRVSQCAGKLNQQEKKLAGHGFIRCHRSFLVNPKFIRIIDNLEIIMENGDSVPISQKKKAYVKEKYRDFLTRYGV